MTADHNKWFRDNPPQTEAKQRLFCFPFAGGGASFYRDWGQHLDHWVDVCAPQLPGRESRLAEKGFTSMPDLVSALTLAMQPHLNIPFMLYGHSMGAKIAFELALALENSGTPPTALLVSGSRPPHLRELSPLHELPNKAFIRGLRRFSGTPEAVLSSPELLELFLPLLRNDFILDETYLPSHPEAALSCPIHAFCGSRDTEATPREMKEWASYTHREFSFEETEGTHFFIKESREAFFSKLKPIVREAACAESSLNG